MMGEGEGKASAPTVTALRPQSPASESFSHPPENQSKADQANGVSKPHKTPADAYEVYCNETRPLLEAKNKDDEGDGDGDGEVNIENELASGWKGLSASEKEGYQTKYEQLVTADSESKEPSKQKTGKADGEKTPAQDEDVEMGNYDTEGDQEGQSGDKAD